MSALPQGPDRVHASRNEERGTVLPGLTLPFPSIGLQGLEAVQYPDSHCAHRETEAKGLARG